MPCTSPLAAYKGKDGAVHFGRPVNTTEQLQLPCGQCMDCRLERSRQWAIRCLHEQQLHEHNHVITLTYKEAPRALIPEHLTAFWKKLRERQKTKQLPSPRYYACGEYGEEKGRPHYHAAVFNLPITDLIRYSGEGERTLYTSKYLEEVWGHGDVKVGHLYYDSAMYIAAYVTKKITGKKAAEHYTTTDPDTGEIYIREPEFARMSLKPAIGLEWIKKYTNDVFNYDHVIVNGKAQKAPRYYDKYLEKTDPARLEKHKANRKEKAKIHETDNTPERLKVKAEITKARLKIKQRTLK